MSRIRIILIIVTILSGLDIGLLWSGGATQYGPYPRTGQHPGARISNDPGPFSPPPRASIPTLVEIRPPNSMVDALTAAGTIELMNKQQVVLAVDGLVSRVAVMSAIQ